MRNNLPILYRLARESQAIQGLDAVCCADDARVTEWVFGMAGVLSDAVLQHRNIQARRSENEKRAIRERKERKWDG
ncbi:MAG: hypothetical protein LUG99_21275 [Lachnospiraceae bacterium]|nr:hypothetical protein [Lachnospiraceae bacterium]